MFEGKNLKFLNDGIHSHEKPTNHSLKKYKLNPYHKKLNQSELTKIEKTLSKLESIARQSAKRPTSEVSNEETKESQLQAYPGQQNTLGNGL